MNGTKELSLKNGKAEAIDVLHNELTEILNQAMKHGFGEVVLRAHIVKGEIQQTRMYFEKTRRFE